MPTPIPVQSIAWPLLIVGRGSSAAYYVGTVDLKLYPYMLAIGEDDAWGGVRGHSGNSSDPTLKINHPLVLLQHFRDTVPGFSEELVDRLDWAKMNADFLDECSVQIMKGKVVNVAESQLPAGLRSNDMATIMGYQVKVQTSVGHISLYAYKVIVALGTGGHRVPDELKKAKEKSPDRVLDLDQFAALDQGKLQSFKRIAVIGPNAAIDGVHKALNYKCKIDWLIDLDEPREPTMLATQPRMLEAWQEPKKFDLRIHRYSSYKVAPPADKYSKLKIEVVHKKPPGPDLPKSFESDYICYGLGPTGSTVNVIDFGIQAKLVPILDMTRASKPIKSGEEETILGYQAEGTGLKTGLEVVGAMANSMGRAIRDLKKTLAEKIEEARRAYRVFQAITTLFPTKFPFLRKDVEFLAKQPRAPLLGQLQNEIGWIKKNRVFGDLGPSLDVLGNLILAYHTAANNNFGENYKKNFATLLNQVATNLPNGAVADSGQLTSILQSLSAVASMRGQLPRYMPSQSFESPGPRAKENPNRNDPVAVTNTGGSVNFSMDNANLIHIFICVTYPNIPPYVANAFVDEEIMAKRRTQVDPNTKKPLPRAQQTFVGFSDMEVEQLRSKLEKLEMESIAGVFGKI